MKIFQGRAGLLGTLLSLAAATAPASGAGSLPGAGPPEAVAAGRVAAVPWLQDGDDLDAFMEKVLRRRRSNFAEMYRYRVREREHWEIRGPGGVALESRTGEYTWYVRDGWLVRSPDRMDGVDVSEQERREYEDDWIRRLEREAKERAEASEEEPEERLEREYFLGFRFEPGNYFVVGRETLDGREVVRVEYYPERLFSGDEPDDPEEAKFADAFEKTTLVTMWILPEEHQIVRITFENVGLDFLPARWLVRVEGMEASMSMHRPFDEVDVWLPRSIRASGRATVATGAYEIVYELDYFDYREAEVGARVRFRLPGQEQGP